MATILFLSATGVFWLLAFQGSSLGGGLLSCAFLPLALGMTYVSVSLVMNGAISFARGDSAPLVRSRRSIPSELRVTEIGEGYVEFEHPHGGSWSYGMSEDLAAVGGVEMVEALGGWRYRMHVSRNPTNAARILEAAHSFRTTPRRFDHGLIELNQRPGYQVLSDEANGYLD